MKYEFLETNHAAFSHITKSINCNSLILLNLPHKQGAKGS
jgi:hypothetical protein